MKSGIATFTDLGAIEQTPLAARDLPPTTYAALERGANINLDKIALQYFLQGTDFKDAVFYTYRDLMGLINQTANMFHALGIGPQDVVSMILPNVPQAHFTIWGGEAAGIVNPINPLLEPAVMADIMNAAGTRVLVTLAPFVGTDLWQKAAAIADQVPTLETILQVDLASYLPFFKRQAVKLMRLPLRTPPMRARVLDFSRTAQRYPANALTNGRIIQPDDIAAYFHTGGTTGTPKLARQTHFNQVFDAWAAAQTLGVQASNVMFCGLPLFHVNGVIVTGLIPWMHGAAVVLGTPQGYRGPGVIANFWQIVDHYKINFFSGVPTVYSALLDVPIGDSDVSSLEFAICGAAPMPVEVFRQFEERTGVRILEGYGLTEGACVSSVNPALGERRVGSIGFRLPYQEMQVVELDAQGGYARACDVDEIGVVIVRGPNVFKGYTEAAHNRAAWVDTGDGGEPWLNTGDLGRQDTDGYFWLTGRAKELIIRGGHNIDPRLIEDPLHAHPAVALAAAVGRPDAHAGELPVAYVQLKPGAAATAEELLDFARARIGERAAVPKAVHIVDALPQTTVGKIFKPQLVWREAEAVLIEALRGMASVAGCEVRVGAHSLHGMAADVRVTAVPGVDPAALEAAVRQTLGQYAIHYDLHLGA